MIKVKFSDTYTAKLKRIRRLPKLVEGAVDASTRRDVNGIVKDFQDGVRKDNFDLFDLQFKTIQSKRGKGYSKPSTPLYGLGDSGKNTYINMFIIKKLKKGYRIIPRWALHHSAGIPLRTLFFIHENGAIINTGKALIRIPPRPAFRKAFQRYLRRRLKGETSKDVRSAMRETIKTGKTTKFRRITNK